MYWFADKTVFDVDVFRSFIVFWATGKADGSFVVDSNIDVWDIKPIFQKSLVLPNVAKAFVQHWTYRGQLPQLASFLGGDQKHLPADGENKVFTAAHSKSRSACRVEKSVSDER